MNRVIIILIFLLSPFLGLYISILNFDEASKDLNQTEKYETLRPADNLEKINQFTGVGSIDTVFKSIDDISEKIMTQNLALKVDRMRYTSIVEVVPQIMTEMENITIKNENVYVKAIENKLGEPLEVYNAENVTIKLYPVGNGDYKGVLAKIKPMKEEVVKVRLAEDTPGSRVKLSTIAEDNNAVFAVNGGGFNNIVKEGDYFANMLGNTVVDGELIGGYREELGLFFAGIDKNSRLVGSLPRSEGDINKLSPYGGVGFLPDLLKDFDKISIPGPWRNAKHPRTVIGKYANEELIFLVIDGRQPGWSLGITLENLQDKLLSLGIKEAYNLDGGGSSAIYFDGKIINKPSDGRERSIPNAFIVQYTSPMGTVLN